MNVSRCAVHDVAATGVCGRCGRFGCGTCLSTDGWCAECLSRPLARLTPSPEARRALWLALLGLHGVVVLLPIAAWSARRELNAITAGRAPMAGKPWAQGALAVSMLGVVLWSMLSFWFLPG